MNALLAVQWPFSEAIVERLGWVLVHSLWQFAVLGLVAAIVLQSLRHSSSIARHGLLVVILAAAAIAPVVTWLLQPEHRSQIPEPVDAGERLGTDIALGATDFGKATPELPTDKAGMPESKPVEPATIVPQIAVEVSVGERISHALEPWFPWIVGGWCVGVLFYSLRPLIGWRMLHRLRKIGTSAPTDEVLAAFDRVSQRLGLRRTIQVLYSTVAKGPLVVGYFRPIVLLPASLVTNIPESQLEAILAHELAHIRRHDFIINLLQALIETLFFYHPAIWWLSHRIRVERELCCDDLVVGLFNNRTEYGRALIAVEQLQGRTTSLAMGAAGGSLLARIRRIVEVEGERKVRMVDRWPTAIALAIALGIAVPIAMLRAADEKPADKPSSAVTTTKPKDERAQALFKKWQANSRTDGKIPGALIGRVAAEVDRFLKQPAQNEKVSTLTALRPRLDASHDWTQADVVALFDDITAISTAPVSWADLRMDFDDMRNFKRGQPLPIELTTAAWGAPAANGLRAAWLLEPRAEQYPLGSVLKASVLFHNTGKEAVVFKTETWHQNDRHTARDAKGVEIKVGGTWYTGVTPTATYRLAPGEYCEVTGHGVAIGAGKYEEEFSIGSVGTVIEAREGDEVSLSHSVDTTNGGWTRPDDPKDPAELWKKIIAERVAREAPMPQAAADRKRLIRRVTLDLLGESPSAEEVAVFTADNSSDALAKLVTRLQAKPRIEPFSGKLPTGETKFRVTAADPDLAKKPRTAISPGRYVLGDRIHLLVSQTTTVTQRTNKAVITFLSPDPKVASPNQPYEIALPDGIGTYGIVWERGAGVLWVMQKALVQKYDFTNPAQVKETRFDPGSIVDVPEQLRDALRKVFEAPGMSLQEQAPQKPKEDAKLPGRLFVNAGLRTKTNEKRFVESAISIDPNTGNWTRLLNFSESGFTVPLSPVRVSPDGRTMLFMRENEIWKCDAKTGENPVRVFKKGQPKAWAPDGKEFIAVAEKEASRWDSTENWRVSADGKKQSVLPLPIGEVVEDWSGDGHWLVGWSHADGQLYIMKPDGSGRRQLTDTNGNASRNEYPRFSPDGRRIVYLQTKFQGDDVAPHSRFSLRTINIDGTDDREILGEKAVRPAPGKAAWTAPMAARWSPDGEHLAVVLFDHTRDGGILAINGNWRLAIIDADGGNLRLLKLEGVLTTVLQGDGPEWRPQPPAVVTREPKQGAQLKPATEQKLKWGEPANGLRMALAWPPTLGEPGIGDEPEFYLVVQNVSQAAVRLTANDAAPNPRRLMTRGDGKPLQAFSDTKPTPGDWRLQPGEVAFLRMFPSWEKEKDGRTMSSIIEEDIRVEPRYSFTADMSIEKGPAGAWTGKLTTGETRCSADVIPPKHKDAQALYKSWTTAARRDGKIPGALIGLLAESVKMFIRNNPTWETTPQLEKMLPRFDASRDWLGQDSVTLLDELTAMQDTPIKMALDRENEGVIRTGAPLPPELANVPWGQALSNGLRHAWLLEPRAAEHRLGTPLKARLLIHNAGKTPVAFRTRTWHQLGHKATDRKGVDIKTESTSWTRRGLLLTYRLTPGEFIELHGPGIGVGPVGNHEDWQQTRVGTWVESKAGDDVTVTTDPLPLMDWNEEEQLKLKGEPRWWLDHITTRLSRHLPFPADADARLRLLHRVAIEVLGTSVSKEMNDAFVADTTPTALDSLAKRLADRPGITPYTGSLQSGPTKYRVLPADPDAAKKPRTASNPGRYTLSENFRLVVSRRPIGERIVNEASIQFFSPDPKAEALGTPVALKLPDGYNTWAAAWVRGGTVLWVQQKSGIRGYDFANPAQVKETTLEEPANTEKVPKPILDALRAELDVPAVPKPSTETPKPAAETPK